VVQKGRRLALARGLLGGGRGDKRRGAGPSGCAACTACAAARTLPPEAHREPSGETVTVLT
jgi:hypothetical protein